MVAVPKADHKELINSLGSDDWGENGPTAHCPSVLWTEPPEVPTIDLMEILQMVTVVEPTNPSEINMTVVKMASSSPIFGMNIKNIFETTTQMSVYFFVSPVNNGDFPWLYYVGLLEGTLNRN